jgi:serine/threonine-protein kinase
VPERALEITAGVLDALDYSHRHGIVHRDIKPANVMLTTNGEVKVMDFGIARAVADPASTMTQTGATLGTAQYLSPEQAQGGAIDPRSDIYSTGCMLYELLTGRPPFTGESPVSVAYQHVRENPVPPSQLDEDVPVAVDAIVMKALAKNPDNRYQTALEMREDIDRALGGRPVAATPVMDETMAIGTVPPTTVIPPNKPSRARRVGFVILGLAVAAAIIGGLIALLGIGGGGATVAVPDLTGQTVSQAQASLAAKKLELGTTTTTASTQPAGTVVSQDPNPSASVKANTKVNLVLSQGPPTTTVPSLSGLTLDAALTQLSQSKLVLGDRSYKASSQPENTIIGQTPAVGKSVPEGSAVNVVVSSGEVQVPSVLNEVQAQAEADLKNAGFKVTVISQLDATDTAGTVIAQNPSGGVTAKQGSIVTITVAVAPPTPTPTPTLTPTPTVTPTGSVTPTP